MRVILTRRALNTPNPDPNCTCKDCTGGATHDWTHTARCGAVGACMRHPGGHPRLGGNTLCCHWRWGVPDENAAPVNLFTPPEVVPRAFICRFFVSLCKQKKGVSSGWRQETMKQTILDVQRRLCEAKLRNIDFGFVCHSDLKNAMKRKRLRPNGCVSRKRRNLSEVW